VATVTKERRENQVKKVSERKEDIQVFPGNRRHINVRLEYQSGSLLVRLIYEGHCIEEEGN
jgi:hypothetical protein